MKQRVPDVRGLFRRGSALLVLHPYDFRCSSLSLTRLEPHFSVVDQHESALDWSIQTQEPSSGSRQGQGQESGVWSFFDATCYLLRIVLHIAVPCLRIYLGTFPGCFSKEAENSATIFILVTHHFLCLFSLA